MSEELKTQIRAKEDELKAMSEKLANLNNKLYTVSLHTWNWADWKKLFDKNTILRNQLPDLQSKCEAKETQCHQEREDINKIHQQLENINKKLTKK